MISGFTLLVGTFGRQKTDPHTCRQPGEICVEAVCTVAAPQERKFKSANHEASWAPTASYRHLSPIPPTPAFFLLFFLYLVVGVMSQALGNLDCADIVDEKEPNQQKVYSTEIHRPWTINEWQAPQKRETHYLSWIQLFISLSRFSSIHVFALVKFSCWNVFPTVLFSVSWRSFSVAWIEAFYMLWVFCW